MNMQSNGNILVVDDEPKILKMIHKWLTQNGYNVTTTDEPIIARDLIFDVDYDTVISDINLPGMSGLELLEIIKKQDQDLPVILITGKTELEHTMRAIKLGAYDFISKPFSINQLLITVKHAVTKRNLIKQNLNYRNNLEQMVSDSTQALMKANRKLEENLVQTVLAMITALEASDAYTHGHSRRVTSISLMIANEMRMTSDQKKILRLGSLLHDIGKIGIDHMVLNKPGRLTDAEMAMIRQHPEIGSKIIAPINPDPEILNIIAQHHEKYDGTGYPQRIDKYSISMMAKIVSVADSFDAMTSERPYRNAMPHSFGYKEIIKFSGLQFDPDVVEAFKKIYNDLTPENMNNPLLHL